MKLIFTTLAFFLFSAVYAFNNLITVSSNINAPIRVVIDNRVQNDRSQGNEIMIRDIRPGYRNVKIYQIRGRSYGYNNSQHMQLIYSRNLYVRSGYHTDIVINRFGKVFVDEQQFSYLQDDMDWDADSDYRQPMNGTTFSQFKQTISNTTFENSKLALARQTISQNYFTSAQIKELVQLFSFEDGKLDIAKFAYQYCTDANNYFIVSEALSFSSSKEELARFLTTGR